METGKVALLHNYFDAASLADIVSEMMILGAPTIRVLDLGFDDIYQAVEGCHRLRACEILGITPHFEYVDPTDTVESLGLDYNDGGDPGDTTVDTLGDWENYQIVIEDFLLVKPEDQD